MVRLLKRLYRMIRGKPTSSAPLDFDTLFALLEEERRAYRVANGMDGDEPEIAVRARRAELVRYIMRHDLSIEEMIESIQQEKDETAPAEMATTSPSRV